MEREITHDCGHTRSHYVGGFYAADREREACRLARRRCADCCRKAEQARSADQARAHHDALGTAALPSLAGSARQIAWAEDIRLQQLASLRRLDPDAVTKAAAVIDAHWWIEHRLDDPATIVAKVCVRR